MTNRLTVEKINNLFDVVCKDMYNNRTGIFRSTEGPSIYLRNLAKIVYTCSYELFLQHKSFMSRFYDEEDMLLFNRSFSLLDDFYNGKSIFDDLNPRHHGSHGGITGNISTMVGTDEWWTCNNENIKNKVSNTKDCIYYSLYFLYYTELVYNPTNIDDYNLDRLVKEMLDYAGIVVNLSLKYGGNKNSINDSIKKYINNNSIQTSLSFK